LTRRYRPPVHPRTCGEQPTWVKSSGLVIGSSPHVRGTDCISGVGRITRRFIPARAGNSATRSIVISPSPVHPRTCGEQGKATAPSRSSSGSSPHVRGTAKRCILSLDVPRFIPARAGNRLSHALPPTSTAVHPRTCGEQSQTASSSCSSSGSSPHVRGTGFALRGNLVFSRFIPARAGNRRRRPSSPCTRTVHPRTCGEQSPADLLGNLPFGSSPHVRGTVQGQVRRQPGKRFIPARAGNRILVMGQSLTYPVHPRTCGEQSSDLIALKTLIGSSPHVRGTGLFNLIRDQLYRFIPARAGNRNLLSRMTGQTTVHPRTCGEQVCGFSFSRFRHGSSPHVRGTERSRLYMRACMRFIPARAGNSNSLQA